MPKENNCRCVVCDIERGLLGSLSTQIARTEFQALALSHPALNYFDSPADVIAQLHDDPLMFGHFVVFMDAFSIPSGGDGYM